MGLPIAIERGAGSGRRQRNHRFVPDGIFWITRTGVPWRDLPEYFGKRSSVYRQFRRWPLSGTILDAFDDSGDEVSDRKDDMPVMDAEGPAPEALLAEGYDADFIRENMEKCGGLATIPAKRNRRAPDPRRRRNPCAAQHDRALLRQAQKRPSPRHTIRQNCGQLPGIRTLVSMRLWMKEFVDAV